MNSLNYGPHSYAGAAVPTTLSSAIGSVTSSITLVSTTNWTEVNTGSALGTNGSYVIALDYGTATEEKVLVPQGQTGPTLSGVTRGYDGTTAASHSNTTLLVVPVFSATEAAEANVAVQAIGNLGGRGTNPIPTDIQVGGSGTGQPGTSSFAAAADHSHPISTGTINGALDAGVILELLPQTTEWDGTNGLTELTGHSTYMITATQSYHNTTGTTTVLSSSLTVDINTGLVPSSVTLPGGETTTVVSTYYFTTNPTNVFDVSIVFSGSPAVSVTYPHQYIQAIGIL